MSIFEISFSYIGSFNHYHEKPHVEVPGWTQTPQIGERLLMDEILLTSWGW